MAAQIKVTREDRPTIGRYSATTSEASKPATLSYSRPRTSVIYLTFACLPEGDEGQALGEALFAQAVDDAREAGDRIVLADSVIQDWFRSHPDWNDVVAA